MEKRIHSLRVGWRKLPTLRVGWRNLGSFMLWRESFITTGKKKFKSSVWRIVLLCEFLILVGNWQFFFVVGKFYYDRKKKFKSSVWRVVLLCQFLVLAGNGVDYIAPK